MVLSWLEALQREEGNGQMEAKNRFCQREHNTTTSSGGVQSGQGKKKSGRASWKRWNLKMSMILAGRDVPGILTEDRKGKGQVVGHLCGQDRLKRKVPDSGT